MACDQKTKHCLGVSSHRALISSKQLVVTDCMVEKSGGSPCQVTKSNNSTGGPWRPSMPWRWCSKKSPTSSLSYQQGHRAQDWVGGKIGLTQLRVRAE